MPIHPSWAAGLRKTRNDVKGNVATRPGITAITKNGQQPSDQAKSTQGKKIGDGVIQGHEERS